jgi:hypothetical protein
LLLVPVAGVRDDHLQRVGHTCGLELGLGGADHRLEVSDEAIVTSGAITICCSLQAACALLP